MFSKDEAVKFFNLMVHNTYEIAPVSLRVSLMEKKAKKIVSRGYYWENSAKKPLTRDFCDIFC